MTSDYVIVPIKSCPEVGNDEKIILCGFGGRSRSVFEVIEGGGGSQRPSLRSVAFASLDLEVPDMFPAKQEKV